jgi:hypothetical protein
MATYDKVAKVGNTVFSRSVCVYQW